jgi:two-component system KDP operon response regulator KdpE
MSKSTHEPLKGVRVLVVDDERAIRRFLQASLTTHSHTVFEATTGREALEAVVTHRPDIIILDLGLPDMGGVEVTRRLREWTQTPVIILSVRDHETDKIAALDAGADDYQGAACRKLCKLLIPHKGIRFLHKICDTA